jgi:urease accessory protein
VVFLNTSGGLASGDRLSFAVTLEPGVAVTATTQTAERAGPLKQNLGPLIAHLTARPLPRVWQMQGITP